MGDLAKEINSTFPNQKVKALLNIKYTASWLDQIATELLKPHNISEQQYNILRILRGASKEITVTEVKERMIQKSPNSTRLMDKLCDKKLIDRSRCESDRRVVFVKITKKGLDLLERINMADFHSYMDRLTDEEAELLNKLLDRLR
ncbi:MarR family winged helix-turn-helix transcriptional regulator [Lutimonas sp.]|jgi:MarR family 2-MHQ and catechol resistance regulon transcriptional repressor|uniref:MarR family winged helix-turn-helix transcriptional regulator n=1 Tax=Lutimonas sp. TaxID=1872403 RepID=UPI003C7247B2